MPFLVKISLSSSALYLLILASVFSVLVLGILSFCLTRFSSASSSNISVVFSSLKPFLVTLPALKSFIFLVNRACLTCKSFCILGIVSFSISISIRSSNLNSLAVFSRGSVFFGSLPFLTLANFFSNRLIRALVAVNFVFKRLPFLVYEKTIVRLS